MPTAEKAEGSDDLHWLQDEPILLRVCGFECIHCCGGKQRGFRRFPETRYGVANEIKNFEVHLLRHCKGVSPDVRSYLNWMKRYPRGLHMSSLSLLVSRRLDDAEAKGNAALAEATRKRALSKKRKQSHSILENVESLHSTLR